MLTTRFFDSLWLDLLSKNCSGGLSGTTSVPDPTTYVGTSFHKQFKQILITLQPTIKCQSDINAYDFNMECTICSIILSI